MQTYAGLTSRAPRPHGASGYASASDDLGAHCREPAHPERSRGSSRQVEDARSGRRSAIRNEDLDANVWGNDYCLKTADPTVCHAAPSTYHTPLDRQNDYGGTFGGPVVIPHLYNGRDKTFFFFSWEQYRQNQGGVTTSTVPTAKMRTGDFREMFAELVKVAFSS